MSKNAKRRRDATARMRQARVINAVAGDPRRERTTQAWGTIASVPAHSTYELAPEHHALALSARLSAREVRAMFAHDATARVGKLA
jgi:hypothetical protein